MCQESPECKAWTRDFTSGQCYLKSAITSTGDSPNWIWGTRCEGQGWPGCKLTNGQYLASGNDINDKWTGSNEVRKINKTLSELEMTKFNVRIALTGVKRPQNVKGGQEI